MNVQTELNQLFLDEFYCSEQVGVAKAENDPIFIVQEKSDVNALKEWGLPALCVEGEWQKRHAQLVAGSELVLAFCPNAFKQQIGKVLDGYSVQLLALDIPNCPNLGAYIRGDGDGESLYQLAYKAKHYEYRDDIEQASFDGSLSVADLMAKEFSPIKWIVRDILPEGLSLLAGPSKLGKSWWVLDIALGVSLGEPVLTDVPVAPGDVLVWALEDNERRLQSRIKKLKKDVDWQSSKLSFATACKLPPTLDCGGLDRLEAWRNKVENPRLIIIDVLEKVRPEKKGNESEYSSLYRGLKDIHRFAAEHGLSILAVHHTNKQTSNGDPFDKVSGSRAFTSLPDATLVMDRDNAGFADAILYGRGRDLIEFELALAFDSGRWSIMDDAESCRRSSQRNAILDLLKGAPKDGYSPSELSELLDKPENSVNQLLFKMKGVGEVKKLGRGRYVLPAER